MADRYELTYAVSRDDWVAVNTQLVRTSSAWAEIEAKYRHNARRSAVIMAPFVVVFFSLVVGKTDETREMYVFGSFLGLCLALLFVFAFPRLDTVDKAKRAQIDRVARSDLSDCVGAVHLEVDAAGMQVRGLNRELRASWRVLSPSYVAGFVLIMHGTTDGTLVPRRVFASDEAMTEFIDQVTRWWQAAQPTQTERLTRYLADRDLSCPKCEYSLRALSADTCPECGTELRLEAFVNPEASRPVRWWRHRF